MMKPSPLPGPTTVLALASFLTLPNLSYAWEPGVAFPDATGSPAQPLIVNSLDRNDVVSFFQCVYEASESAIERMEWTGSLAACLPGTTSSAFQDDVQRRVNYFRAMAAVRGDIDFSDAFNQDAQAAALIMAEHNDLSHTPLATWGEGGCWSGGGETGANLGNLNLGSHGPAAINAYIEDSGLGNAPVGHRRWILNGRATLMGTGDVPSRGSFPFGLGDHPATNCLYVNDAASGRAAQEVFAAWPPPGFVPKPLAYDRWSLQFNSALFGYPRFGSATVTMTLTSTGTSIPSRIEHAYTGGPLAADPALVWVPDWSAFGGAPPLEQAIEVRVEGLADGGSGSGEVHTYTVTIIDPDVITDPLDLTGPAQAPASGATYQFQPLSGVGADAYEIEVTSAGSSAPWLEGAEDNPAPAVLDGTSTSYALREPLTSLFGSPGARSGSRAFHLAFPSFSETEQSLEIDRSLIAGAETRLRFAELFRWSSPTSRLTAEVSVEGGAWTEVWGQSGNGALNTAGWVKEWTTHEIDLSAHAGRSIRVRFVYAGSGSLFLGTEPADGVYLDDITVTGAEELGEAHLTALSGTASQFTLTEATAGRALEEGMTLYLRLRPILGGKPFPFGPAIPIEIGPAVATPGFAEWVALHGNLGGQTGFGDDPDGDGIPNGAEFGFGLNPAAADALPALTAVDGAWEVSFSPAGVGHDTSSLEYGAEFSVTLEEWTALEDRDPGEGLRFVLPAGMKGFVRWTVSLRAAAF